MIEARLVPDQAAGNIARAGKLTPAMATATVAKIMHRGRTNIVQRTHVGWSGALRGGYDVEIKQVAAGIRGSIVNPILYHDIAEEGRNPGRRPPTEALIPWVGSKLGIPPGDDRRAVAFLVARKIGAAGYEGHNMVADGWKETRRQIRPELSKLGLRIVRVMGGRGT